MAGLRSSLTDEVLLDAFGTETLARGVEYAEGGRITHVQVGREDRSVLQVRAIAAGQRARRYSVELRAEVFDGFLDLDTVCSCPIYHGCKHGAALALVVRGDAHAPEATRWERDLRGLLEEFEAIPPVGAGTDRLALQVALQRSRARRTTYAGPAVVPHPTVQLRPLREGARRSPAGTNWIKTGIKWQDLSLAAKGQQYDAGQVEALARMYAALVTARSYWSTGDHPQLFEFGPSVWHLLGVARDAGVEIVPAGELEQVELLDEPLDVGVDVVESSGGAAVRLQVRHDDEVYAGGRLLTVGQPAHGVVLIREVQVGPRGRMGARATLAPLRRPIPPAVVRQLGAADPLVVPPAGRTVFESRLLPRLQRQLRVASSDGSVVVPDRPRPGLRLTVTWASVVDADLHWEVRYGGQRLPLASSDDLDGLRDRLAEAELVSRVEEAWPAGRPADTRLTTAAATLELAEVDLPTLCDSELVATGLVDVVESGRPDFRAAEGELEVRFDAVPPEPGEARSTDWLDLMISIRVDDETVPLPDVLAALTSGADRLLLPSGLHVATDRPELAALRDLVLAASELRAGGEDEAVRVGADDLGLWAQLAELGLVDAQAAEWVRRARALRDLVELPRPDPTGVVSTMRSYQLDGFHWLAFLHQHGLGGILADDMGLGKTLQVLALVSHARAAGSGPFLVVAPTSVVSAWQSEAARHTPHLDVRAVTATAARRIGPLSDEIAGADVVVTSYTLLRLDADEYAAREWGGLVLDEAQQVKNHQSRGYQAVRRVEAPFKLAVTGTPFENRLLELWSLLSITNPGLYPWPDKFTEHVARPVEKEGDQAALTRFRARIRPFLLRRTKELVAADLPPKQEQVLEVQLSSKHRRVYDTHLQKERQKVLGLVDDFGRNRVAIFASLTRLRQLALDAALVDPEHDGIGSAKLDSLVEHLHEIGAEGHRALVFSQFTGFLGRVRARLEAEGLATSYLDGSTRDRPAVIEGFRSGTTPVFLISLKAGGVGLTLTEADYVFVLDPWWNPAAEAQAVDRAHRIGQERPVMVYRLVATDTIEEKVMELKARKAELFARVVDGDGAMSAAISAEDVRALFE